MAAEARATVQVCKQWAAFPTKEPSPGIEEGQAPQASWSWELGGEVPGLEDTWPEWVANAEDHLCVLHDIPESRWKHYKGRGAGLQLEEKGVVGAASAGLEEVGLPRAGQVETGAGLSQEGKGSVLEAQQGKEKEQGSHSLASQGRPAFERPR